MLHDEGRGRDDGVREEGAVPKRWLRSHERLHRHAHAQARARRSCWAARTGFCMSIRRLWCVGTPRGERSRPEPPAPLESLCANARGLFFIYPKLGLRKVYWLSYYFTQRTSYILKLEIYACLFFKIVS